MSKTLLSICLSVTLFAAPALKAGSPGGAAPAEPFSWTGLYLGGNLGWNWGDYSVGKSFDDVTVIVLPFDVPTVTRSVGVPGFDRSDSEFLGGGQLGYNYQFGAWVVGLEGDFDATSLSVSELTRQAISGEVLQTERSAKADWMASARARAGFAWQRVLFYATGGAAFASVSLHANDTFISAGTTHAPSSDNTLVGWTAGAGAEVAVSKAISIGLEYRYSDFGDDKFDLSSSAPIAPHATDVDFNEQQVTLRVNLLFGGLFGH